MISSICPTVPLGSLNLKNSTLYPRHTTVLSTSAMIPSVTVALLRDIPLSIIPEHIASMIDIQLVSAANSTMMKKTAPSISPATPIWSKILGIATNISPGPAAMPSLPRKTYTAGMIITPARKATTVSKISIWLTDLIRLSSSLKYEP